MNGVDNKFKEISSAINKLASTINRINKKVKALQGKSHKSRKDRLIKFDCTQIQSFSILDIESCSAEILSCEVSPSHTDNLPDIISSVHSEDFLDELIKRPFLSSVLSLDSVAGVITEAQELLESKCKELNREYIIVLNAFNEKFTGLKNYEYLEIPSIRNVLHFFCLITSLYDDSNSIEINYLKNLKMYNEKNYNSVK